MVFCPECKGEVGQADTACPRCGYDFPSSDDSTSRRATILGTLGTALLTIILFVAGFFVQSFAMIRWGESITAFWFVMSWAFILAWAFLSYRIARAIIERLFGVWT